MKVLNLQCTHQHSFEGWFASEDDFQSQLARGLIECPLCADKGIKKMPSAPRLNLGGHSGANTPPEKAMSAAQGGVSVLPSEAPESSSAASSELASNIPANPAAQAAFLTALRQVVSNTEDVGERFADEARRMHYGDVEARSIRGQASVRQAVELLEEGIEVLPLPMLPALKETLQ
ncbi:MAG: DUF1178 family protein [Pseudomonadota bacterium]